MFPNISNSLHVNAHADSQISDLGDLACLIIRNFVKNSKIVTTEETGYRIDETPRSLVLIPLARSQSCFARIHRCPYSCREGGGLRRNILCSKDTFLEMKSGPNILATRLSKAPKLSCTSSPPSASSTHGVSCSFPSIKNHEKTKLWELALCHGKPMLFHALREILLMFCGKGSSDFVISWRVFVHNLQFAADLALKLSMLLAAYQTVWLTREAKNAWGVAWPVDRKTAQMAPEMKQALVAHLTGADWRREDLHLPANHWLRG